MYGVDNVVEDDRVSMDMTQRFPTILYNNQRLQNLQQYSQADLMRGESVSVVQEMALNCSTVEPDGSVTYRRDGWAPIGLYRLVADSQDFQTLQNSAGLIRKRSLRNHSL